MLLSASCGNVYAPYTINQGPLFCNSSIAILTLSAFSILFLHIWSFSPLLKKPLRLLWPWIKLPLDTQTAEPVRLQIQNQIKYFGNVPCFAFLIILKHLSGTGLGSSQGLWDTIPSNQASLPNTRFWPVFSNRHLFEPA